MITKQNLDVFLEGVAILGTGGGGSPAFGKLILENDLEVGRTPIIVQPEEVPDDAVVASGGFMGSVKLLDKMNPLDLVRQWENKYELTESFQLMEETIGRKVDYVIAFELGGLNTPVILSLGARTGRKVINGDGLGRAAPETHMVSFIGHGISLTPMPLVATNGNSVVVRHGVESTFADKLGRWMITRSGGMGANSHYPMSGLQMKKSVIPNTLTKSVELGKALQLARKQGADPVQVVADQLGGKSLGDWKILVMDEQEWEGFYFTRLVLTGGYDLIIKNETMALFKDDTPITIFPDLICILDPETGSGLMSANLKVGDRLSLVVSPCHPTLREALISEAGAQAFSPAQYGQPELKYRPVEELLSF
jgi:DUF917 family protein